MINFAYKQLPISIVPANKPQLGVIGIKEELKDELFVFTVDAK